MTAAARITEADMKRATKAVAAARFVRARIIMDLAKQRIEIIIGEATNDSRDPEQWGDDYGCAHGWVILSRCRCGGTTTIHLWMGWMRIVTGAFARRSITNPPSRR